MWLALSTVILINKEDIGRYLLIYLNQIQSGELTAGQVSISPLRQFPHFSLILENITYYEHQANKRRENEQPIARIENFSCGIDLLKLFQGDFEISKVNISKGELLVVIYPDSSVNLLNAIKVDSTTETKSTPDLSTSRKRKQVNLLFQ